MRLLRRRHSQTRAISEAVAYARCHGDRDGDLVRVVKLEPRRPRYPLAVSGEALRRAFESRLDARPGMNERRVLPGNGEATRPTEDSRNSEAMETAESLIAPREPRPGETAAASF